MAASISSPAAAALIAEERADAALAALRLAAIAHQAHVHSAQELGRTPPFPIVAIPEGVEAALTGVPGGSWTVVIRVTQPAPLQCLAVDLLDASAPLLCHRMPGGFSPPHLHTAPHAAR